MWQAYWQTVKVSPLDWFILVLGVCLILSHAWGFFERRQGTRVLFMQNLDSYRTFLLLVTELLPVLGLLGTVLSLMYTFKMFQVATEASTPDISQMVRAFAPAMSTTISGLLCLGPNLLLNAVMWLCCPSGEGRD